VRSFLAVDPPRHATIATVDADGTPHQVVIWYTLVSDDAGDRFLVNSRRGRRWPSNLERERRANLAVNDGGDAVTIECVVDEMYEGESARDDISQMALRYDAPDEAQEAIATFRTQQRITFVLRPTRVHTHGDPN
jgi:hypothetical protein